MDGRKPRFFPEVKIELPFPVVRQELFAAEVLARDANEPDPSCVELTLERGPLGSFLAAQSSPHAPNNHDDSALRRHLWRLVNNSPLRDSQEKPAKESIFAHREANA